VPKSRIIVVDSDESVAGVISALLVRLGYHVTARAPSGELALEHAAANRPDLALIDLHLRGELSGMATARRFVDDLELPVVSLTSMPTAAEFERAAEAGAYACLPKPFDSRELKREVDAALGRGTLSLRLERLASSGRP